MLGACAVASCFGAKSLSFPMHLDSDFVMTRMITDRIGRHELLLPLLNQQEVERVVVITD